MRASLDADVAMLVLEWGSSLSVVWILGGVRAGRLLPAGRGERSDRWLFAILGLELAGRGHLVVAARKLAMPSHLKTVVLIGWESRIAASKWTAAPGEFAA